MAKLPQVVANPPEYRTHVRLAPIHRRSAIDTHNPCILPQPELPRPEARPPRRLTRARYSGSAAAIAG
jgi:hypothetical protein